MIWITTRMAILVTLQFFLLASSRRTRFSEGFDTLLLNAQRPISLRNLIHSRVQSAIAAANAIEGQSSTRRYVLIRKNKQSMAFRNGSPLVFSGSVKKTIQVGIDAGAEAVDYSTIPMGSLVAVVVADEADKPARRGRGGSKEAIVDYNHFVVDKIDRRGFEFNRHGELRKQVEDVSQIEDSLAKGKLIGFGLFNPVSMYRVFILCHQTNYPALFKEVNSIFKRAGESERAKTEQVIRLVLRTKIHDAMRSRLLMNLPSESTDSYRLINGEGDGLAGLVVDILGGKVAVIMASAGWVEIYKETIMSILQEMLESRPELQGLDLVWRNTPMRLQQDGYEVPNNLNLEADPRASEAIVLTENKIKYYTYPYDLTSQKTGFYCDQRENRYNLALQCKGKNVLDLCCYNGGFALNAVIHGGAKSSVGVDSSQDAIDSANANAELNGVDPSAIRFVKADIAKYMTAAKEENEFYDIIVLDPPKLAPTVNALERASRKYHSLNRDAMKLINPKDGGLLLTCTCSGAMTQKNGGQYFLETVKGAALAAGRRVTLIRSSGAAPCHVQDPASFPANAYLTAALFYISGEDN